VTHVVAQGETLIGLAVRYGLSLEALQQANPGVQAEALSIGMVLVIPLASDAPAVVAGVQPTPMPVTFGPPACHPLANGALYCFVEARNPGAEPLESVTARVTLAGADGLPLAEAVAQPALDQLPAGAAIPLVAFFADAPAGVAAVGVTAASAFPLSASAGRYLPLEVTVEQAQLERPLTVFTGTMRNPAPDAAASVRLAVAVYDDTGVVAGCVWVQLETPLARPFEVSMPVIGAAAVDYQVWAEGRP
jgi:LysM repeat protein